jgi:hypothetical protein
LLVEVTSLNREAVERRSGWPDELSTRAGSFGMITPNLWSKAKAKAPQLADVDATRVLVVCLSHIGASALLGTLAAEWLMISEPKIEVPLAQIGVDAPPPRSVTDFRNAAFFRPEGGTIVAVRRSISAILLVALWQDQLEAVGLLHPDPAVALDYTLFGDVPFLRVEWPVSGAAVRTEWVVGDPNPSRSYHMTVTLTNAELRGE